MSDDERITMGRAPTRLLGLDDFSDGTVTRVIPRETMARARQVSESQRLERAPMRRPRRETLPLGSRAGGLVLRVG